VTVLFVLLCSIILPKRPAFTSSQVLIPSGLFCHLSHRTALHIHGSLEFLVRSTPVYPTMVALAWRCISQRISSTPLFSHVESSIGPSVAKFQSARNQLMVDMGVLTRLLLITCG
jgi:hypothetical protein